MSEQTVAAMVRGGAATSKDGTRIAYLSFGAGPRLVFLPGGLGAGSVYKPVADHLAATHECVLIDRRGLGCSDFGAEPYALQKEAEDVLAVIERVGPVAGLVGHSHGAVIALLAALADAGQSIASLVLYEPAMGPVAPIQVDIVGAIRASVESGDYEQALNVYFDKIVALTPDRADAVAGLKRSPAWLGLVSLAPVLLRGDAIADVSADDFAGVSVPALLLYGSETLDEHKVAVDELDAQLPSSRVIVLEGHGHTANLSAPDFLAETIGSYVDALG